MSRRIVILCEGETERAAKKHLKGFLDARTTEGSLVGLVFRVFDGGLNQGKVANVCEKELEREGTLAVIALSDFYPAFKGKSAEQARAELRSWMPADPRCHACLAKHDFEAWLLVDSAAIARKARLNLNLRRLETNPENVNHDKPPAHHLHEIFQNGPKPRKYVKPVDGKALFENLDLVEAGHKCPELKRFLSCLLVASGCEPLE